MAKEQRPTKSQKSRYRKSGIYFSICIMLMLGGGMYLQRQAIYDQLYDWKLIPRPERLTELYFAEHGKLPKAYVPAREQMVVRFTVRNLEYRKTTYRYTLYQQDKGSKAKQQLATGSFALAHDKHKTLDIPVRLTDQGAKSRVVVNITYDGIAFGQDLPSQQKQAIYYWVEKEGQP